MSLVFDIETGPQPEEELRRRLPDLDLSEFEPSEFDESSVKTGNLKDPEKIKAKVEAARQSHKEEQSSLAARREEAKEQHWSDFYGNASLSATHGEVVAIGFYNPEKDKCAIVGQGQERNPTEADVIAEFWSKVVSCVQSRRKMVGLNIFGFDLPFLVRRSWILGIPTPPALIDKWRFWNQRIFTDLRVAWLLGEPWGSCKSSFDELATAFGTESKPDGITGADFARLWREDQEAAIRYLEGDLKRPAEWAKRMGLL